MNTTSVSLLDRLKTTGADESWSRFVDLYTPLIFFWARKQGLTEADASDLVQDVMTLMLRELPKFEYDRSRSFRGWLRTVTINKLRDRQRQKVAKREVAGQSALDCQETPDEIEFLTESEYRNQLVSRAMELMKTDFEPSTWRACWEHIVAGRPAAEVAAELGITPNAVYIAKYRVVRRLQEELQGMLD